VADQVDAFAGFQQYAAVPDSWTPGPVAGEL